MSTFDHGVIAGLEWHTHWDATDRPVHTHTHPGAVGHHNHDDCVLIWDADDFPRLRVGSVHGPRLAGEVVPLEIMHAALAGPPSEGELASARSRLGEMLSRLDRPVAAPGPCSCHCHTFGGSHVVACC